MNFNKFGKFIFPTVTTLCTLDVLSSVYDNIDSYDISYQESGNMDEEGFPHTVKNMCRSDVEMISAKNMLFSREYMDYFVENKADLRGSDYFPVRYCQNDDSLHRKEKEAAEYFEKNFESLQSDYKKHLDDAKKYLLSESSYEIKNTYAPTIEYEHSLYDNEGKVKIDLRNLVSSFSIEEVDGKPFDKLKFYIKPSKKQMDLITKANDYSNRVYRMKMNLKLDSMKDFKRHGCNEDTKTYRGSRGLLDATVVSYDSACIATKLVDAEISIIKYDGVSKKDEDKLPEGYIPFGDDESNSMFHWKLLDTIPIKWE